MQKKDIPNFEGIYAATSDGHIWSYKTKQFSSERLIKGYYAVHLITSEDKTYLVHRLVVQAFLSNPENKGGCGVINGKRKYTRIFIRKKASA